MIRRTALTAGLLAALFVADGAAPAHAERAGPTAVVQSRDFGQETARKARSKAPVRVSRGAEAPLLRPTKSRPSRTPRPSQPQYQSWMSSEITDAWSGGFLGQGTTIISVDDFSSGKHLSGNLGTGTQSLRHGEWVRLEGSMLAPSAGLASHDFASGRSVALAKSGLSITNLSYGMFARSGYSVNQISWSAQESSLISHARNGAAVVVKAAGNDAVAVGAANRAGNTDYLNVALIGTGSAIFVGALDRNGTTDQKANLASYSNFAGSDATVQDRFVTVGVRGDLTGLYGTSFAAPVVSGYAAVLGSKFTTATPGQIGNRLLDTARTDTINGYDAAVHGRGEASITRALAPATIR